MVNQNFISEIIGILGQDRVILDSAVLQLKSRDALETSRAFNSAHHLYKTADVLIKPNQTMEISTILRLANKFKVPVIPRGGGSGVMGGLVPVDGGIILDLSELNKLISINVCNRTVTVEAGILLETLKTKLESSDLILGHDPWSVPIATIGGAISTNGIGYRASITGSMGSQVLGMKIVLPTGDILTTPSVPINSGGLNLNNLFIGSEGTMGIITQATIMVFSKPELRVFNTYKFNNFTQGFNALSRLFEIGIKPAVIDLTEDKDGVHLYLVHEGYAEGVEAETIRSREVCSLHNGIPIGPKPTAHYWETRYDVAINYKNKITAKPLKNVSESNSPLIDFLHVALPISRVLQYRRESNQIFRTNGIKVIEQAIWTNPEFYSIVVCAETKAGRRNLSKAIDMALILAQDLGGIMEYCHGVGIKLQHLFDRELGTGIDTIKAIKSVVDPNNIMNPGKIVI